MAEIVKFHPANAADSADNVLEQSIGQFCDVLILGVDAEGHMDVRSTSGLSDPDVLFLMEKFKHILLSGVLDAE